MNEKKKEDVMFKVGPYIKENFIKEQPTDSVFKPTNVIANIM